MNPEQNDGPARVDAFAERILAAQDITDGTVAMRSRTPLGSSASGVPALHVAAVLHALADHTTNERMLRVARKHLMARPGDGDFAPETTSLGRWFHAVADSIERSTTVDSAGHGTEGSA